MPKRASMARDPRTLIIEGPDAIPIPEDVQVDPIDTSPVGMPVYSPMFPGRMTSPGRLGETMPQAEVMNRFMRGATKRGR